MKEALIKLFDRMIGEPKPADAPAPSTFGAEASNVANESARKQAMNTELTKEINRRRMSAG